jgi:hypothetical protein
MLSAGFEAAMPASDGQQTLVLDRSATYISTLKEISLHKRQMITYQDV